MQGPSITIPAEAMGWLASALTLLTFLSADMRRLRGAALAANLAFIAYGWSAGLAPVLVLHLVLVPVNLWRLRQAWRDEAAARSRGRKPAAQGGVVLPFERPPAPPGRSFARRRAP